MTNIQKLFPLIALAALCSCTSRHIQRSDTSIDSTVIKENRMLKEALEASGQTIERLVRDSSGQTVVFGDPIPMKESDSRIIKDRPLTIRVDSVHIVTDQEKGFIPLEGKRVAVAVKGDSSGTAYFTKAGWEKVLKQLFPQQQPRNTVTFKDGKIESASGDIKSASASDTHTEHQRDSLQTMLYILEDSLHTEQANKKVEIRMVEKRVGWPWYIWFILGGLTGPFLWELIKKYYKKWTV